MESIPRETIAESIKSLQSTIRKSEKALVQMTQKGAYTTLITKRLNALTIGLALIEYVWKQTPCHYSLEELTQSHQILIELLPSLVDIYAKSKDGSPQRTLLERRIKALELAVQAIEESISEKF